MRTLILCMAGICLSVACIWAQSQPQPLPVPPPPPPPSPVVQSLRNKDYQAVEPAQRVYDTCKSCYQGYRYREDDTPFDTTFFMGGVFNIFT